jgi:hypothetical protein
MLSLVIAVSSTKLLLSNLNFTEVSTAMTAILQPDLHYVLGLYLVIGEYLACRVVWNR